MYEYDEHVNMHDGVAAPRTDSYLKRSRDLRERLGPVSYMILRLLREAGGTMQLPSR